MGERLQEILAHLPGKDCGQCGFKNCRDLAERALEKPELIRRCLYLQPQGVIVPLATDLRAEEISWKDILDREYDLVLEQFPEDPGPREIILPFNPDNLQRLGIKKGDVLFGRPAWVGCPVTHVGLVMDEPDYLSGTFSWCVIGPLAARERGIEIGNYNPVAYEGLVRHTRQKLEIGRRYHFLPRTCMMQSRHSGVVSAVAKRGDAYRVRLEGIMID